MAHIPLAPERLPWGFVPLTIDYITHRNERLDRRRSRGRHHTTGELPSRFH
jgi:hypothetical protein